MYLGGVVHCAVVDTKRKEKNKTLLILLQHPSFICCTLSSAGQTLERNAEDISILMGRGVEMARSEPVHENINTLQNYIDQYGRYR